MADSDFERKIQETGERLHASVGTSTPSLFDRRSLMGRLVRKAITDPELRTALFRFVDVLPMLDSAESIAAHFRGYLESEAHRLGPGLRLLFAAGGNPFAAAAVRRVVETLARRFVVAERERELDKALAALRQVPAAVTVDAVGEAVFSEVEGQAYAERYLLLLDWLADRQASLCGDPRIHVSIKLSGLTADFDPLARDEVRRRVFARLRPMVERARRLGAGITVDMEQYEYKPLLLDLFRDWVETEGDGGWLPGIALQTYLPDTDQDLVDLIRWARRCGHRIGVRLVKGAYWDTEVALARQRGWPIPVSADKAATDARYERLTRLLFEHADIVQPAIASHNLRTLSHAIAAAEAQGLRRQDWEIQMLYGMAEPLAHAVVRQGLNLRIYLPVGELIPGIAYLIRRLVENTSATSILRQEYLEGAALDRLLAPPILEKEAALPEPDRPWGNLPLLDFSRAECRERFRKALETVRAELGRTEFLTIAGAPPQGAGFIESVNPAVPAEILGRLAAADESHAEQAVRNAAAAFPLWRGTPVETRVALCRKAADLMQARREYLAAWQVLEVGKNWREADADVAEAVDYLRYYALRMEELAGWKPTVCFPGETNHLRYEPRGVAVVIPPWNFPLAILAGMTAAALVAGNVVILKPASPAGLIARRFHALLREVGFPRDVCQLLPGSGETVGGYLVGHPQVQIIAFTGSREVGLGILRKAHTHSSGQTHVKQVVCEMGGKNAVIVDDDADLDEAVHWILHSAFGYQGQKCSAASRVIALGKVHDRLVRRLADALDSYLYGPPEDPAFVFGPLINRQAQRRVESYLEIGRREGRLYYLGRVPREGFYHPPAIFTDIEPCHRLAREEIFGPLLAVLRASRFADAVAMALNGDYALTGGVFSRLPAHLTLARERLRVGNLYLNRGITGARVGVQPFGGAKLSGTGMQAGGPDYLKEFLWTRVVSENTLRHGFVPFQADRV
jgi:RHH-type proline utilization regulon transcriptional repressor/proline dehydrogenase/delta 1-pyrroline-5-carboxylate dehydrogenase